MKQDGGVSNNVRAVRLRLGLSQQRLAEAARVSRQTISGIEASLYSVSAEVALRIARALGCPVEELFWLEEDLPTVQARPAQGSPVNTAVRVSLARVGDRWIAHSLDGDRAFRTEMIPADGVVEQLAGDGLAAVRPLDDADTLARTVVVAGCTPALSLWTRSAERWHPGLRVHWTHANSMAALDSLGRGEVHAAGVHLYDAASGEHNIPFVRQSLPDRPVTLVNLGTWEEGLVVRPGNPKTIRDVEDLAREDVAMVNRDAGAGSRLLLDTLLSRQNIPSTAIRGYDRAVRTHQEVARAVAAAEADAGLTTAALADAYGLGFVPLQQVRYDLAVLTEYLRDEPVRQLLSTLHHRWIRSQLQLMGGYDTSRTGDVIAEVERP